MGAPVPPEPHELEESSLDFFVFRDGNQHSINKVKNRIPMRSPVPIPLKYPGFTKSII
jgi:hypothetical protein